MEGDKNRESGLWRFGDKYVQNIEVKRWLRGKDIDFSSRGPEFNSKPQMLTHSHI